MCMLIEYREYCAHMERNNEGLEGQDRIEPECYADFLEAYGDWPLTEGYWRADFNGALT